ncbi:MAG: hypothetical protein RLZZ369_861 [Pseudomonadota bacterium]
MADTHGSADSDFDLTQFYQVFFEEAAENLDQMEQMLLNLDLTQANDEELNGIFRCAHSIKGGSATFGFTDVAELTHKMESLLDRLRRHEITPIPEMVDALLESADASRSLLARHQAGGAGEAVPTGDLVRRIVDLAAGNRPNAAPATATAAVAAPAPQAPAPIKVATAAPALTNGERLLQLKIGPVENLEAVDAIKELFRDIPGLGSIEDLACDQPQHRLFQVKTQATNDDLLDLMVFHVSKEQVHITDQVGAVPSATAPMAMGLADPDAALMEADVDHIQPYGLFDGAPGIPDTAVAMPSAAETDAVKTEAPKAAVRANMAQMESTSIRVDVKKVDQLINLAGELVIIQAMLAQNSQTLDPTANQQLLSGLADLDRNTRDLQEAVMSIRMIPMSTVFSRFPRMLRDLANKLGKKVELVTQGEATELDKGLVEKITDPLTHLVRNSCDHGVEMPADRIAKGKPEVGTITLAASHQGGSIVIEVRDDGRGLNRDKLLSKAREKGIDAPDSMTDSEVWGLIFAPGFSTADQVTDVSGRGVGMDVVKKNITSLGGTVEIDSAEGYGMRVAVRLPLTLAIMDGMSVGVGEEVYILPLSSVVESFQVSPEMVKTVGGSGRVVEVRDEYMPVIELEKVFQVPRFDWEHNSGIMVVVEAEGGRVAMLVDELLGQQQVVVKNLESNYRKVSDVSGATIMGDGRVALILDVGSLVRRSRH